MRRSQSRFQQLIRAPLQWQFWAVLSALLTAGLYAYLGIQNPHVGFLADDALYLLAADLFSPFQATSLPVYEHVHTHSQLPPLFPLTLAWLGAGSDTLNVARVAVAGFTVLAYGLMFAWLRARELPPWQALALTLCCAWSSATLLHVADVFSEGLYMCWVWCAMLAYLAVERRPRWSNALLAGVLTGLAIGTRSVGIALLVPLAVVCVRCGRRVNAWVLGGLAGMLVATFLLAPNAGLLAYGGNAATMYGEPGGALKLLTVLRANAAAVWFEVGRDLFLWVQPYRWRALVLVGLLLLAVIGLVRDGLRLRVEAMYALTYGAVLVCWPYPEVMGRLLWPLVPFLLYFMYRGLTVWLGRHAVRTAAFCALLLVLVFSASARIIAALATAPPPELASFRTTRYWLDPNRRTRALKQIATLQLLGTRVEELAAHVPNDACIYTVYASIVLYAAKRIAWMPPSPQRLAAGPPWDCEYFYIVADAVGGREPYYPAVLLKDRASVLLTHELNGQAYALLMQTQSGTGADPATAHD